MLCGVLLGFFVHLHIGFVWVFTHCTERSDQTHTCILPLKQIDTEDLRKAKLHFLSKRATELNKTASSVQSDLINNSYFSTEPK